MSKITRFNYEVYIIDYLEGNLSPEMMKELEVFAIKNPDLNLDLDDDLLDFNLELDEVEFDHSSLIDIPKKFEPSDQDLRLISALEGDLSDSEISSLQAELTNNKELAEQWRLFQKTILPASTIEFPHKSSLIIPATVDLNNKEHLIIAELEGDLDSNHPQLRDGSLDFQRDLFRKTFLQPDLSIEYPHKDALLKKQGRVVAVFWKRAIAVAVAACLIGFTFLFRTDDTGTLTASANPESNKQWGGIGSPAFVKYQNNETAAENNFVNSENTADQLNSTQDATFERFEMVFAEQRGFSSNLGASAYSAELMDLNSKDYQDLEMFEPELYASTEEFTPLGTFIESKVKRRLDPEANENEKLGRVIGTWATTKFNDVTGSEVDFTQIKDKKARRGYLFKLGRLKIERFKAERASNRKGQTH